MLTTGAFLSLFSFSDAGLKINLATGPSSCLTVTTQTVTVRPLAPACPRRFWKYIVRPRNKSKKFKITCYLTNNVKSVPAEPVSPFIAKNLEHPHTVLLQGSIVVNVRLRPQPVWVTIIFITVSKKCKELPRCRVVSVKAIAREIDSLGNCISESTVYSSL